MGCRRQAADIRRRRFRGIVPALGLSASTSRTLRHGCWGDRRRRAVRAARSPPSNPSNIVFSGSCLGAVVPRPPAAAGLIHPRHRLLTNASCSVAALRSSVPSRAVAGRFRPVRHLLWRVQIRMDQGADRA
jgi:hypothetical protein